ncbi:phosphodiester glycosidase family protein [Microbacterium sp. YY-03]|uniref:phosphodiester glycosidase family protein n=1 Tax=Microbacterium sp. YY-03 TaxID=3421636 RepID=UPI003D17D930
MTTVLTSPSAPPRRWRTILGSAGAIALVATLMPLCSPAASAYNDPTIIDGMVLDDDGAYIVNDVTHTELSPGLDQVEFERIGTDGRQQLQVLRVQLADSNLEVDYIGNDALTKPGTVTEFVNGSGAIAGVNGDFFDINNSSAPLGTAITRQSGLIKSPDSGRNATAGFTADGLGAVVQVMLEGAVTTPNGTLQLAGINRVGGDAASVIVYNSHWGTASRARSIPAGKSGTEVIIGTDGRVARISASPGSDQLADGEQALVAQNGPVADALRALSIGDAVSVDYQLNDEAADLVAGIGGHGGSDPIMLTDGVVASATSDLMSARHPRTGVGFSEDGRTAYFVVADGRQSQAAGLTVPELGELMVDLGAWDAINLDGGGSSQMNARQPGDATASILNSPSDGNERQDANGLGIFLRTEGSLDPAWVDVRTTIELGDAVRVFPGLTRTISGVGVTENGGVATNGALSWASTSGSVSVTSTGDATAVITGVTPGTDTIAANVDGAVGELAVSVLGDLERISASSTLISFKGKDDVRTLSIIGHDANGYQAPIDPADITVTGADESLLSFTPSADGSFDVTAIGELGSSAVTFSVAGQSVVVPITVGLNEMLFTELDDAADWKSGNDRAPGGSVVPAPGHDGDNGLTLTYDFTQSTATRGQYAIAPGTGIELPGQPQKLTMWIYGDGQGGWPRLQFKQGSGATANLDGPHITWEGWQRAEFDVPAGVTYPLTFQRFRLMETGAARSYSGEITISSLAVAVAPDVEMPTPTIVEDPVIVADGATDAAPLRIAVMSDAQFVARNPDSDLVAGARRALQEIVAADPDLLVINGDLVDEASPEDFELAKRVLDEELAGTDFPYYYVPGNHEIMGGALENFQSAFGSNFQTIDVQGTKIVMLDSSTGALFGKPAQLEMLQSALADATADASTTGVIVFQHHPLDDPLATKSSQLSNRLDAALLRDWMETFRETSGKSIAFMGSHVGVFHATREDGISYLVNGNSGKGPAGSPFGEFTGWTMLGIDPGDGLWKQAASSRAADDGSWLGTEVQARVDSIALADANSELAAGDAVAFTPTIAQPGDDAVDVAWPMSWSWSGSKGVFVGAVANAPADAIAVIDPQTHVFTALTAGEASVSLTINGVTETRTFSVTGGSDSGGSDGSDGNGSSEGENPGDGSDSGASDGSDGNSSSEGENPGDGSDSGASDGSDGNSSSEGENPGDGGTGGSAGDGTAKPGAGESDDLSVTGSAPSLIAVVGGFMLLAAGGIAFWRKRRTLNVE